MGHLVRSNYGYDTTWKDKLTSFDGKAITYDAIGNPIDYNVDTYTWDQGRQLAGMTGNGKTITYKYNDSGIRTQKTVNGVTTTYHLVGDKVTYEENGTDKIYYTYGGSDNLVSMNLSTKNPDNTWTAGIEYYYVRNAQGDIIGIVDANGAQVVSYVYDTWGKLISTTGTLASTVGVKNPYLYRGYRCDTETGLYYLQSRYYSPSWGRFLNADGIIGSVGELLGHNVFAYCKNNPTTLKDPSGFRPVFTEGEETDEMRDASYKVMNTKARNSVSQSSSSGIIDKISDVVTSDVGGAVGSLIDSATGYGIDKLVSKLTRPIDYLFSTPKLATGAAGLCAVGIGGGISLGFNIREDVLNSNGWDTVGRIGIDVLGTAASIGLGVFLGSVLAPTLAGVALGAVAATGIGFGIGEITKFTKEKLF